MCIYLGKDKRLTYDSQEHILPAALGCCTKLEKGVVSDQANAYFSPIERDIIQKSLIQLPRIIKGPGKRGKLEPKYATTSNVCPIKYNGENSLGYMKGQHGHIISQFIIDSENNIHFHYQSDEKSDVQNEILKLKQHIVSMGEKYVPVEMPKDDERIYIAYFKNKIHIGFHDNLSEERITEIKDIFKKDFSQRKQSKGYGQISATIEIQHNLRNLCIIAAKSAINTLAYLKGAEYITQTDEFRNIIKQVMSDNDEIFNNVKGIGFEGVEKIRQRLHLNNDELACVLFEESKQLKAKVFFYEYGFDVFLSNESKLPHNIILDGIVSDWKNRKDYRYIDYLSKSGVLSN